MQPVLSAVRRSSLLKVAGIAILVLLMLIPMAMTRGVIHDRSSVNSEARYEIMRSWGNEQTLSGPMLVVPYKALVRERYGDQFTGNRISIDSEAYLLPETLRIHADMQTEIRYRGIHEFPVYTATTVIEGTFSAPSVGGLGIDSADIDWSRAYFALPVADARAIRNTPEISINGSSTRFESNGKQLPGFPPLITAAASALDLNADNSNRDRPISFRIEVDLGGTERIQFLPLGDTTEVSVTSDWPSPSFAGTYLPEEREIDEEGFSASWRVTSLGRALPSRFLSSNTDSIGIANAAFGVDLFVPVGLYQLADRATKYAVLFIGLTFVAYFLFEVLTGIQLHPIQYLLVGFSNTLFYLMLLSFAEHVGFGIAYVMSSVASIALIATYSVTVLKSRRRATTIVALLAGLYCFLYLTLKAESYAMLAGTIGLWVVLAVIMYLTRKIDWYRWGGSDDALPQDDMFAGKRT